MQKRAYAAAIALLTVIAVVRVASTHRVFSATLDEPIHLASGFEWWGGEYTIDITHPPLSRILCALPLRLAGYPEPGLASMIDRGNQLLYHGNRYEKSLARARMGNLVLLVVAILAVAALARRTFSEGVAIVAVAIFTSVPPILGHAGLITTDLAIAAMLPLALLALDLFLDDPTPRRAIVLGIAIGLGVLSKLSFFLYFPIAALVMMCRPGKRRVRGFAISIGIAFFVAWSGYHFHFERPSAIRKDAAEFFATARIPRALADVPLPAPELPLGLAEVRAHERGGHTAFLLGKTSRTGWWYYFPVVFFFKTPIPLLILFGWGTFLLVRARHRRGLEHALIAAAIMLLAMTASLNIGLRHILPIYAPISIVAAYAVAEIWNRRKIAAAALLAWLFIGAGIEHPDYLPWFNEAARPNPARIAVDSNLDWGQDILRLARVIRERRIDHIYVVMNNSTRLDRHGIPAEWLPPRQKVSGWVAAGENWTAFTDEYDWLKAYRPVQRVGKSIRLYHIP